MPIEGNGMHEAPVAAERPTADRVLYRDKRLPEDPFEQRRDYTKNVLCDIGWALKQMHDGQRVCRAGWNGKGMWLGLVKEWAYGIAGGRPMPTNFAGVMPFIVMFTADGYMVPWLCSQADILALDWQVC